MDKLKEPKDSFFLDSAPEKARLLVEARIALSAVFRRYYLFFSSFYSFVLVFIFGSSAGVYQTGRVVFFFWFSCAFFSLIFSCFELVIAMIFQMGLCRNMLIADLIWV